MVVFISNPLLLVVIVYIENKYLCVFNKNTTETNVFYFNIFILILQSLPSVILAEWTFFVPDTKIENILLRPDFIYTLPRTVR